MFKRAVKVLFAEGRSPFECYYASLLLRGSDSGRVGPTAREAQRDYDALRALLKLRFR